MSYCCVNSAQLSGLVFLCAVRLLIWVLFNKGNTQGELKQPLLFFFLCACCYPTFSKIDACYFCVSLLCSCFSAPLTVLRDFGCSVKSAAALVARPSRAVIQTSRLLEYKSCPEFALVGNSSRGSSDYLFIWVLSGHDFLLSAGDSGKTRYRLLISAVVWCAHWGLHNWLNRIKFSCLWFQF